MINVLCHLPYLQNVILCHTSNQKVFLFIPWEVGDLAGVSPMYEKQFWGPILSILWCLLLPNSVTNSISPSTSTTIFDKIYEPYTDLMPTTIPWTSQLQHMEFSCFVTKKTSNSQLCEITQAALRLVIPISIICENYRSEMPLLRPLLAHSFS